MSRRSSAVQRHAKEIMRNRASLSSSEFGSTFFPQHQTEIAAQIRDILERVLIVDVSRIEADDKLIEDLGLGVVDGLDANFVEFDIHQKLHVSLRPAWPQIKTVRDVVTYVSDHRPRGEH